MSALVSSTPGTTGIHSRSGIATSPARINTLPNSQSRNAGCTASKARRATARSSTSME
jgi:hypothetical protein